MEKDPESMSRAELEKLIGEVQKQMKKAAAELNFEAAAELRDKMIELEKTPAGAGRIKETERDMTEQNTDYREESPGEWPDDPVRKIDLKKYIRIRGANEHNLKNVSLNIPRNQFVVLTGLSGSGKSSLAFDTIYAEGQRRYMESLSSYARQFLGQMEKPEVESIEGLSACDFH